MTTTITTSEPIPSWTVQRGNTSNDKKGKVRDNKYSLNEYLLLIRGKNLTPHIFLDICISFWWLLLIIYKIPSKNSDTFIG